MTKEKAKKGFIVRALDTVERVGNGLPNPATIFLILTGIVIVLSAVCAALGVSVTYDFLDSASGEISQKTVQAVNLLAPDSIRHMVTTVVSNFTGFFALGTVFTIMIGVGVADRDRIYVRIAAQGGCFHAKGVCDRGGGIPGHHVQYCFLYRLCCAGSLRGHPVHGFWTPPHCRPCGLHLQACPGAGAPTC